MTDTFSQGVEPGGLHTSQEIKLLICYMLRGIEVPLTRDQVLEVLSGNGIANFFDTADAIDELLRRGLVCESAEGALSVTGDGKQVAESLVSMLPYTVREAAVSLALQTAAEHRRARDNHVDITPNAHGFAVTCTVGVEEPPLMRFTVQVADRQQAALVRSRFLADPETLYRTLFTILTDDLQNPTI